MSTLPDRDATKEKWDARYRNAGSAPLSVAEVLINYQQLLPMSGKALDLACGLGGNALFLAQRGLEVHAWDISPVAVERLNSVARQQGLVIHTRACNIIMQPPAPNSFDLIVVSRYLERELCPVIATALKPGGLLFYQTYTRDRNRAEGPRNPHFLLAAGELLELFSSLEVQVYQEGSEALFIGRRGAAGL